MKAVRNPDAPIDWPDKFLSAFRKNGNVSQSARLARVHRATVYERQSTDPEFAALFEDARAESADVLEQEARRRAVTGTLKPIYYKGEEVGQERQYSDTLLIVLLKANNPDKFRDNSSVDVTTGGEKLTRIEVIYGDPNPPVYGDSNPPGDAPKTAPGPAGDHSEREAI